MNDFERTVNSWLDEEWSEHISNDLKLISHIPNGSSRHFVDYYRSLPEIAKKELIEGLRYRTKVSLGVIRTREPYVNPTSLQALYDHGNQNGWKWKYAGLRTKKLMAAAIKHGAPAGPITPEQLQEVRLIESVKTADLRAILKPLLCTMYPNKPENRGRGEWLYKKELDGFICFLWLSYGQKSEQIQYQVGLEIGNKRWPGIGISYEGLLSINFGGWDQIEAKNIPDDMERMCNHIKRIESLFVRVIPFLLGQRTTNQMIV